MYGTGTESKKVRNGIIMMVSTLTLHLPTNYGNALQTFALHKFLVQMGYETEVVDAWFFPDQDEVRHSWNLVRRGPVGWLNIAIRLMSFTGYFWQMIREFKLERWIKANIRYGREKGPQSHFDLSKVKADSIVVGSDQVWNPLHATSEFFLLSTGASGKRRIAYAASFGSDEFPDDKVEMFRGALKDFDGLSVREISATRIVRDKLGFDAALVADPTLLHSQRTWMDMVGMDRIVSGGYVFCYFVTPDILTAYDRIVDLARTSRREIHVCIPAIPFPLFPPHISQIFRIWRFRMQCLRHHIHMHVTATPAEFVRLLANSACVVTDSFHGMMFSTIFEKMCNVVIGAHSQRQQMSARLRDYVTEFGDPSALTRDVDLAAARKFYITPRLAKLIEDSKDWLQGQLK